VGGEPVVDGAAGRADAEGDGIRQRHAAAAVAVAQQTARGTG
jgi:hypothetical protein